MVSDSEWLQSVKSGDRVIYDAGRLYGGMRFATVERVTQTQVLVNGVRFRKADGWQVGADTWHSAYLRESTPEFIRLTEIQSSLEYLRTMKWSELDDDALIQIARSIKAAPRKAKRSA